MPLPIVARILGIHKTEEEISAVHQSIPMFDPIQKVESKLDDDKGKMIIVGREYPEDKSKTIMIIMPSMSLFRYGKPFRSDIRWLWKRFGKSKQRAKFPVDSVLTMLWTNEPELYVASNETAVANWAQPQWAWEWIRYTYSLPIHIQKKGVLQYLLDEVVSTYDDAEILASTLGITSR